MRTIGQLRAWIAAVLSNDEMSSDKELVAYFMANGIPELSAWAIVSQRDEYLGTNTITPGRAV